jgi:hypothetical protein
MRYFTQAWAVVCCTLASVNSAPAATIAYVFDQSNYVVAPGGTVNVDVHLREIIGVGERSVLATDGLIGAGVRVFFDDPIPGSPAGVLSLTDISGNAQFDLLPPLTDLGPPALSAGLLQFVDIVSPPVLASGGPTTFEILLGTFTFTAGATAGEVTAIRAVDFGLSDDTVTGALVTLDALIATGNTTITVQGASAAVPEPNSVVLVGAGVFALLAQRVRRRRSLPGPDLRFLPK